MKLEYGIIGLIAICIIGIIYLLSIDKDISVLSSLTTALIGFLVGKKYEVILGAFKK